MAQLASEPPDLAVNAEHIADLQDRPLRFLLGILGELKRARLVRSSRGAAGGILLIGIVVDRLFGIADAWIHYRWGLEPR